MRVLQIGQLPKEMGGNYTTGVARVVGELSRYRFGDYDVYLYATNISNEKAQLIHSDNCKYLGYVKRPLHVLAYILLHPIRTVKAFHTYRITEKTTSFLHMEFIRDNFVRVLDLVKPDIIHYHGSALSAMHFAQNRERIPILYSPHAMVWVNKESGNTLQRSIIKTAQLNLSFANHFTALNRSVVERMKLLEVDENRITVVPNGVDSRKFYFSKSERERIRRGFGVSDDTLIFTTVGLVINRKGQLAFLKTLQNLGIDYQYWIIGKGPDENAIKRYVEDHSIQDHVKLLGYKEDRDIFKYLSAADFYAHVSFFEAQALSEIEASACGLRVIVNSVIADTVVGDSNTDTFYYHVLCFDKPDLLALKDWMKIPRDERSSRSQYDWQVIADKYASVYEKMI